MKGSGHRRHLGYLGVVAAEALAMRGHEVLGLARSERNASALRVRDIEPG